jgi:hypothetical protein
MLGYMFWGGGCQGNGTVCTYPPNTCQAGVGVGASTFNIPTPGNALRQNWRDHAIAGRLPCLHSVFQSSHDEPALHRTKITDPDNVHARSPTLDGQLFAVFRREKSKMSEAGKWVICQTRQPSSGWYQRFCTPARMI